MVAGSALLSARAILAGLAVHEGAHVADLGTGCTGHFALRAADVVGPTGRVYAVDILPSALSMVEGCCALRSLHQVWPVWGDIERDGGVRIPSATLDVALLVHTLHMLKDRVAAAREVRRMVKPGGRVVVIDWQPFAEHAAARNVPSWIAREESDAVFLHAGYGRDAAFAPSRWHWGRVYTVEEA